MKISLFAFTETDIFTEDLLSITNDETMFAIQNELLKNPTLGDVIKGTSGARKGRVGNPKEKRGKSGGFRFIYVYLEKAERIYLIFIYSKKQKSDISDETKKPIAEMVKALKKKYGEQE
jgi:hypothetical protein